MQGSSSPSVRVRPPHTDEEDAHATQTPFASLRTPGRTPYSRHEAMTRDARHMQDAARCYATGGCTQQLHTNVALTARGERRFMSIKAGRKGVSELVDHVGRIVTETARPVPQIDGHGGSSVSQEEGFATSVMYEALDTGLIVASPDEVIEFFGQPSKLLNVDLTESGWPCMENAQPRTSGPKRSNAITSTRTRPRRQRSATRARIREFKFVQTRSISAPP